MASKISVVINTLNEEKNLPRAIASVKNFADEIIVCDMQSTDATTEIAGKLGAKVFSCKKTGYVEPARNYAISKASGDWIFVLDADEEVSSGLARKIKEELKNPAVDYYRIPRKNIIFGKWMKHSRWWPDYNIRFFKKGSVSWNEVIHAVPMTQGKGGEFSVDIDLAIIHHHYDTIEQYINRLNRYTTVHAATIIKEGYTFSWKDLMIKPANEFFSRYFMGEGYKDGINGLALSLLQAFSELAVYLKVWQAEKFKEADISIREVVGQMRNIEKDTHFWQADAIFKSSGKLFYRIKRALRI
jgi:(heptosyl)LPS beta-1,4-glucosyltransferase